MDAVKKFEDLLALFDAHGVRYLIIGGLAFIYHAKPRHTKDMDLLVDADSPNVERVNRALEEFGAPGALDPCNPDEFLQIGVAPNSINILRDVSGVDFDSAWQRRIDGGYGDATAFWIALDDLVE